MKQGFEITRERTVKGQKTVEVEYGITSLAPGEANARRLLDAAREHWMIENELHYVRDVTLKEDACRVRKGNAPQILAALRNAVLHLLHEVGTESAPEALEILQLQPARARELIGIPQIE